MSRALVSVTLDNLDDLPRRCRRCVFWELDPVAREDAEIAGDPGWEKEAWVSAALLEWGGCGKLAYVDGHPGGFVLYAPPALVPRASAFPTSPISGDAAVLMTANLVPEFTGTGLGRMLIQAAARDLLRRGFRALEAFGDLEWTERACVLPAEFLLAVGFKTVRPHPRFPRLRLDLRAVASWRADVEQALDQLLASVERDSVLRIG